MNRILSLMSVLCLVCIAPVFAQKNVDAAQAIFKITNNKYRAGQVLLLEFLDAQNRITSAQLHQLLSRADMLLKEAALKKAAGI